MLLHLGVASIIALPASGADVCRVAVLFVQGHEGLLVVRVMVGAQERLVNAEENVWTVR